MRRTKLVRLDGTRLQVFLYWSYVMGRLVGDSSMHVCVTCLAKTLPTAAAVVLGSLFLVHQRQGSQLFRTSFGSAVPINSSTNWFLGKISTNSFKLRSEEGAENVSKHTGHSSLRCSVWSVFSMRFFMHNSQNVCRHWRSLGESNCFWHRKHPNNLNLLLLILSSLLGYTPTPMSRTTVV